LLALLGIITVIVAFAPRIGTVMVAFALGIIAVARIIAVMILVRQETEGRKRVGTRHRKAGRIISGSRRWGH
jgi:heme A synthase